MHIRSELANHVANLDQYVLSLEAGRPVPLWLRSGHCIHCNREDTPCYLIYEIFVRESYTGGGFYVPKPADTVLDLGAHIGVFALFLTGIAPGIRIHCFEPHRQTLRRLQNTLRTNHLENSISAHGVALGSGGENRVLRVGAETGHTSFFSRSGSESMAEECVSCLSLAEVVRQCARDRITLLKIDTEGAECEIIASGDADTFRRIDKIALEFHDHLSPGSRARSTAALQDRGFAVVKVDTSPPFTEHSGILLAQKRDPAG